ncbi:YrhA family protein [Serratia rubidaea]|uniref:SMI1 / KNR4 family n=1 Tax=Serratia rubidaea TaxID=61652 RepID=A0ABS0MFH1_SERRU|nr:YrhA family protein [Serratia rubidaea]MBH1930860.1 hypothetical protein [Serratia rubidaea]
MKNIEESVNDIKGLVHSLGVNTSYVIEPGYTGDIPSIKSTEKQRPLIVNFWSEYHPFLKLMDGFDIDGYELYGISNKSADGNEKINIESANRLSSKLSNDYDEQLENLVIIGGNGTDIFVCDLQSKKWDVRDRIAIDEAYESHDTFESFLSSVVKTIMENNS